MVRIIAAFLFLGAYGLWAQDISRPYQVIASHIEPKGIGYKEGYSSFALFFAWPQKNREWFFLGDARGHVFNKGKIAINGGLGARYRGLTRLYGIYSYYDFRQSHGSYNQISLGFESIGKRWDVRVNGYLPIGRTEATYDTAFVGIQQNALVFSHKREFALSSVQAEAAFHFDDVRIPCFFSIGPYWMHGRDRNAWGGEARFAVDLGSHVRLEGNTSYDHFFKWIGQGRFALIFSFGPRKEKQSMFEQFALERTCRREIIPLDRKHARAPAMNPKTGEPYLF